jgi:uncharacterized protein Yka (UPF0111/DUF47 family)
MSAKLTVIDQLGESALLLPELIARGLSANDRIKYYLTLLQAAKAHAEHPEAAVPDLRREREASGIEDGAFDEVVAGSRRETGAAVWLPHATRLQALLFADLHDMLKPVLVSPDTTASPGTYAARLEALTAQAAPADGDVLPAAYVDALTRATGPGGDSVHRLVMDLHRELNRLQATIARESLDGAAVYGLSEDDRVLVRAFMQGLNATAPLKFDHPGLATTATRTGARLSIQNDIGTTDAHVIVIHVEDLTATIIYADVHRSRATFLKDMLSPYDVQWSSSPAPDGAAFEMSTGRLVAGDRTALERYLTFLGSRLVFLIDWNRARKRLQRFVRKSDALAVLKRAAEHNVGHRAFLQAGDTRLVYAALERTRAELRYGMRLDEFLGREEAQTFLESVLRLTAEGLTEGRSLRLIQDEVEAELLTHLQTTEHGVIGMAAEHATLIVTLAERLQQTLARSGRGDAGAYILRTAELAKKWETQADEIVKHSRRVLDQVPAGGAIAQLVSEADDVADALEEAAFFLTLLPNPSEPDTADVLRSLADLLTQNAKQYVRLLEYAKDLAHAPERGDLDAFLVTVDQIVRLEHDADGAERLAQAVAIRHADNFRQLHVVTAIAGAFEEAADGLARCALMVRDRVLGAMADRP